MQIDLRLIEAFALVLRCGSLTKAEEVSGISKATLSRQILSLEKTLGSSLLSRRARGMAPTEAGRVFYAHCEAMLAELTGRIDTARVQVQEMNSGVTGTLSILADSVFSTTYACHVGRLFKEKHPNVQVRLDVAQRPDALSVDEVDCYICSVPPDIPNMVGKLLGRISYGLYASPSYLSRKGVPATPIEMSNHDAIILSGRGTHQKLMLHSEKHSQPQLSKGGIWTNDYWVMKTYCLDGFGIAALPDFFVQPEVLQGTLVPVLQNWKPEWTKIYCAYPLQRYRTRKLQEFVEMLAQSIQNLESYNPYVGYSSAQANG
ncbi:LysR family transcriptional regulator [Herbaspirillum camelliae]|uniref:LysR family transcriptional regulator n=1 Tax=Herbaspirillum camelliae TaxID=1892903 RepID=UPI000949FF28|nr:LysR family transcriptional regulator [Herbaspirillum camelliae]